VCFVQRGGVGVNEHHPTAQEHAIRVPAEVVQLAGEALRVGDVVGVHAGDEFAPCGGKRVVQRTGDARVGAGDDVDPGVVAGVFAQDGQRAIGRSVVNGDQLEVRKRLRENAFHRGAEVAG